jgi:hypothetical protein
MPSFPFQRIQLCEFESVVSKYVVLPYGLDGRDLVEAVFGALKADAPACSPPALEFAQDCLPRHCRDHDFRVWSAMRKTAVSLVSPSPSANPSHRLRFPTSKHRLRYSCAPRVTYFYQNGRRRTWKERRKTNTKRKNEGHRPLNASIIRGSVHLGSREKLNRHIDLDIIITTTSSSTAVVLPSHLTTTPLQSLIQSTSSGKQPWVSFARAWGSEIGVWWMEGWD